MKRLTKMMIAIALLVVLNSSIVFAVTDYYGEENDGILFKDISADSNGVDVVSEVVRTGIMTGYEDGTFRPNGNISRAECAAVVCRFLGEDANVKASGYSRFSDVPSSHWAIGYIEQAAKIGIINGYDNTTFGPDDDVLYEQVIKMLVCAKGNGDDAERKGGYPYGYISVAKDLGITDDLDYSLGKEAIRIDVAKMLYNVLKDMDNAYIKVENDEFSTIID